MRELMLKAGWVALFTAASVAAPLLPSLGPKAAAGARQRAVWLALRVVGPLLISALMLLVGALLI
jgi:hypothetical protein